jgi:hypothetical protein
VDADVHLTAGHDLGSVWFESKQLERQRYPKRTHAE